MLNNVIARSGCDEAIQKDRRMREQAGFFREVYALRALAMTEERYD